MPPKSPAEPTEPVTASTSPRTDWFAPTQHGEGFAHYLEVLRARAWWILVAVAICVAAAVIYLQVAAKSYEASSDVLVTPVPRGSTSYIGLGLPLESSDPTRDVETAARLIASTTVAARVKAQLGLPVSAQSLLDDVEARPVAQSSIVTITARADTPRQSARIATAFARAAIAERTRRLDAVLDTLLPSFRSQLAQLPPAQRATDPLAARLRDLEALRLTGDPTLQLETAAVAPSSPATPRTAITLIAAVLGGLIIGIGCALGGRLFGSRLRNEDALRRYRIPILARIPAEPRQHRLSGPPAQSAVPPATRDAYRLLATSLMTSHNGAHKGRILVTGPTEADGKSTTALGLAGAFAALKEDVVLIELDTRSPSLANTLGIEPEFDLVDVSEERVSLSQALVPGNKFNMTERVRALLLRPRTTMFSSPPSGAVERLAGQAQRLRGWLIFDAPALNYIADALPVAKHLDTFVIVVVRLENTRLKELDQLADLLSQHGITPAGFVLLGTDNTGYYGEAATAERGDPSRSWARARARPPRSPVQPSSPADS